MAEVPLFETELFHSVRDGYAEGGVSVQDGDADLEFGDLTVEVTRNRALPQNLTRCILVSSRLRRWNPLHRRQSARPRYFAVRRASFRARAPAVLVFQGFAFLRGGMTAWAPRSAIASWHLRVS